MCASIFGVGPPVRLVLMGQQTENHSDFRASTTPKNGCNNFGLLDRGLLEIVNTNSFQRDAPAKAMRRPPIFEHMLLSTSPSRSNKRAIGWLEPLAAFHERTDVADVLSMAPG